MVKIKTGKRKTSVSRATVRKAIKRFYKNKQES